MTATDRHSHHRQPHVRPASGLAPAVGATGRGPDQLDPKRGLALAAFPRRIRGLFAGETLVDSARVALLHETGHTPVYYVPVEDVRTDLLVPTDRTTHCPRKGDARYWSIKAGERVAENAVWAYPHPLDDGLDLSAYVAFDWNALDAWFEEDEQVFVHPKDPYTRIDVRASSRRVEVWANGLKLADSNRPRLLFETGLPTRYYLPKADVHMNRLMPSETETACPYKGVTSQYWSVELDGEPLTDVAWCYEHPTPEAISIAGLICFYDEKVDVHVDGQRTVDSD